MIYGEKPHTRTICTQGEQRIPGSSKTLWKRTTFWTALVCAFTFIVLSGTACKSKSGSREFIPGKGWIEN